MVLRPKKEGDQLKDLQADDDSWLPEQTEACCHIGEADRGSIEEQTYDDNVNDGCSSHFLVGGNLGKSTKVGPQRFRADAPEPGSQ
jgi:hypothetical protein